MSYSSPVLSSMGELYQDSGRQRVIAWLRGSTEERTLKLALAGWVGVDGKGGLGEQSAACVGPRPETCGFILYVGPRWCPVRRCHVKRCVCVVRGHSVERGARRGGWSVHAGRAREKVVTHTQNASEGCPSMMETVLRFFATLTSIWALGVTYSGALAIFELVWLLWKASKQFSLHECTFPYPHQTLQPMGSYSYQVAGKIREKSQSCFSLSLSHVSPMGKKPGRLSKNCLFS